MKFDITVTITAAIALVSLISPVIVALINNRHHRKMRELELEYDITKSKLAMLYENKKTAFSNFLVDAGRGCFDSGNPEVEMKFYASSQNALLFASEKNRTLISQFIQNTAQLLDSSSYDDDATHKLQEELSNLAVSLNEELTILESDIYNYKNRK